MDDWELLQAYAHKGSESAFQRLVERYVGQVHAMAMREMGDAHMAQDVTQAVFLILVRKAGTLNRKTVLSGWLFNTARHVARTALRGERRRQEREMQILACSVTEPDNAAMSLVESHLNDALASLGESDRNALMLRYFQQWSVPAVAASLGTSDEAAQKRIERAVEKLRRFFGRCGVAVPAVALLSVVSAQAVQPAPPLLVQAISALGVASAPAASAAAVGLMHGALKSMLLSKLMTPGLVTVAAMLLILPVAGYLERDTSPPNFPSSFASYDLAAGFSETNNPNDSWAYGWKPTLGGAFTLLTVARVSIADNGVVIPSWQLTRGMAPAVFANNTTRSASTGGGLAVHPPGTIWFGPGQDGRPENFGVIRFTVPAGGSGNYAVKVAVAPMYDNGVSPQGDTDFHLLLNGTELFGRFLAPAEVSGYTNSMRLAEGDQIDFAVGRGADGLKYGSGLRIQARLDGIKGPAAAGRRQ